MTEAVPVLPPELIGDETLFRALRTRAQQQDKRRAFLLRANEREEGLSVRYNCTGDECENELEPSYGLLSVVARRVKGIGLRVVPDSATHANIKDVPYQGDDADRAFSIAGQLSSLATTIREGLRHRETG